MCVDMYISTWFLTPLLFGLVVMQDPSKFAVAAAPAAGAASGGSGGAAAAPVEEKKDEPAEESDDDMGFSLFD